METTIVSWGYIVRTENQTEATIVSWGYIGENGKQNGKD